MNENRANEPRLRSRIPDARGRSVTVLDPVRLHMLRRSNVIEADALEAIVEELEPGTAKVRRHLVIAGLALAVLAVGGLVLSAFLRGSGAWRGLVDTLTNPAIFVRRKEGTKRRRHEATKGCRVIKSRSHEVKIPVGAVVLGFSREPRSTSRTSGSSWFWRGRQYHGTRSF
ncbi:MAG: hypothetical protein ACYS0G_10260 [Planctomycetota bacterium]|jgi:hypothetical protein